MYSREEIFCQSSVCEGNISPDLPPAINTAAAAKRGNDERKYQNNKFPRKCKTPLAKKQKSILRHTPQHSLGKANAAERKKAVSRHRTSGKSTCRNGESL